MQLVTYFREGQVRIGALSGAAVIDLNRAYAERLKEQQEPRADAVADLRVPPDMMALLEGGPGSLQAARQGVEHARAALERGQWERLTRAGIAYRLSEVSLRAPLPRPGKILCLGLNYRDHAAETGMALPKVPVVFAKFANAVIGPSDPIVLPKVSDQIDYEAELAVVIGKRGKHIPAERALDHVAGYTCFNDVSARDFQTATSQWTMGKAFDGFAPMGPALVTREEVPDPHALAIRCVVNGEVLQMAARRNSSSASRRSSPSSRRASPWSQAT